MKDIICILIFSVCFCTGCIGPAFDEYQADVDEALAKLEAGIISPDEFRDIREAEAEELRDEFHEEMEKWTKGPITGNVMADSLIGLAFTGLGSAYGLNRYRNGKRKGKDGGGYVPK